jgi:hypothetical protein
VSEEQGGTGRLGLLDAWRSFDWAARGRLVKLYAKIFILQVALVALFGTIVAVAAAIAFRPLGCKSRMIAKAMLRGDTRPEPF